MQKKAETRNSAIELLRIYLVEKSCVKVVNRYSGKITALFGNIFTLFKNFVFGK